MTKNKGNVLIFCAHPDDEILGMGGTIAKYRREGYNVYSVVFSCGEGSHWWLKKKHTIEMRKEECENAGRVVGSKGIIFLGLKDTGLRTDIFKPEVAKTLKKLITKYKPVKIFTHSIDDMLYKDHLAVNEIVFKVIQDLQYMGELYTFNIWAFNFRRRDVPKLYVDITSTFKLKMKALRCFKSQWLALGQLLLPVIVRALKAGFKNNCRFAEEFYKLR